MQDDGDNSQDETTHIPIPGIAHGVALDGGVPLRFSMIPVPISLTDSSARETASKRAQELIDLGYETDGVVTAASLVWYVKKRAASRVPETPTATDGENYVWRLVPPSSPDFAELQTRDGYLVRSMTPAQGVWLCKRK